MTQREVTDKDNTRWTCVQAYAGTDGTTTGKAAELSKTDEGEVPVICTPNGGAKSVRIFLNANWEDQLSDEDLLEAITSAIEE